MNSSIIFLITLVYDQADDRLIRHVALKVEDRNTLPEHVEDYPMEDESRNVLHNLLPDAVTDGGIIVEVSTTAIDLIVMPEAEQ